MMIIAAAEAEKIEQIAVQGRVFTENPESGLQPVFRNFGMAADFQDDTCDLFFSEGYDHPAAYVLAGGFGKVIEQAGDRDVDGDPDDFMDFIQFALACFSPVQALFLELFLGKRCNIFIK